MGQPLQEPDGAGIRSFMARQPIFDTGRKVFGYELLCRSGVENLFTHENVDQASTKVIADSYLLMGMETLTHGKKAFLNLSEEVLVEEYIRLFPKGNTVVEIHDSVTPGPEIVLACRNLKRAGYLLALDDYRYDSRSEDLLRLADIVKVDMLATPLQEAEDLARRLDSRNVRLLAEKVETEEMFRKIHRLGYDYFQGYFFSEPDMIAATDIPAYKLHYMEILREIHRPDLDFEQIEQVIKREPSLCYKLLRYINSVSFSWRSRVESIQRALILMGEKEIRKWASFVTLASMADDRPNELMVHTSLRARFCELLAPLAGMEDLSQELFLLGIFSTLDVILGRPFPEILAELPVQPEIRDALEGRGGPYQEILEYVLAYERGDWDRLDERSDRLSAAQEVIPGLYMEAADWVSGTLGSNL